MRPQAQDEHRRLDGDDSGRIDREARRLHAESLRALSPQTLSRLRATRHGSRAAAAGP
ncbi:MAG: hypothetical protein H0W24_04845, partial [Lysobacter sp.]|nr:hypothetical protein [Lysobacter sp.]